MSEIDKLLDMTPDESAAYFLFVNDRIQGTFTSWGTISFEQFRNLVISHLSDPSKIVRVAKYELVGYGTPTVDLSFNFKAEPKVEKTLEV